MSKNQLRKHLKWSLGNHWRYWRNKQRIGHCGEGVFFERDVQLMRFPKNISIADYVVLKSGAKLCACNATAHISIGKNTTIGYHTFFFASAKIVVGDDCMIAPFVYFVDSDHNIQRDQLMNQQGNITAPIKVGSDVWIGTGAKILKGVTIGDGAVVAAGALVKDDVAPYSIVGGVPAKKISERT